MFTVNTVIFYPQGSRIDHAHHDNLARKALYDVLALEDAVAEAIQMTDEEDTLIIVTADHSHVFNINGYPYRGTNVFGMLVDTYSDTPTSVAESQAFF